MTDNIVLVDIRLSDACFNALTSLGFSPLRLPAMPTLPSPIASHTDILAFKLGERLFLSKAYFDMFSGILSPLKEKNTYLNSKTEAFIWHF